MKRHSWLFIAGLSALTLLAGMLTPKVVHAERPGCPQLDRYLKRVKGSSTPYHVYFLKVSGLEDFEIPRRARAGFARGLIVEGLQKDGFFADFSQDGCRSLTFTRPVTRKYIIRSSSATTLVLEGAEHQPDERGTVQLSNGKLDYGTVLLNLTFSFNFVDGCQGGGRISKPITLRALVVWGSRKINVASERAASATAAELAAYAGEWKESAGCEKPETSKTHLDAER